MTTRLSFFGGHTGHVTRIKDDLHLDGVWWLPENSEVDVGGRLTITPSHGAYLNLHGALGEIKQNDAQCEHDLILGLQRNGHQVTLHKCKEVNRTVPMNWDHLTQRFAVETVYAGTHVEDVGELVFDEFYFSFTFLSDWLRNVGLGSVKEIEEGFFVPYDPGSFTTVSELTVAFEKGELTIKSLPLPFDGEIDEQEGARAGVRLYEGAEVSATAGPLTLEEVTDAAIVPLRDFVTLVTCQPNTITQLSAHRESEPYQVVQIYSQMPYERVNPWRLFNQQEVILYADDVRHDFETVFGRWLGLETEMREVCEWFYSANYPPGAIPADRFLNVVKSLESYHRIRFGAEMMDPIKYKEKANAIIDASPKALHEWLKEALHGGNAMPLGSRLAQLVKNTKPTSREIIPDPTSFCQAVVQTRNFYSHLDPSDKSCVIKGENLGILTETLMWLMRLHFLREMGLSKERTGKAVNQSARFKHLSRRARRDPSWC